MNNRTYALLVKLIDGNGDRIKELGLSIDKIRDDVYEIKNKKPSKSEPPKSSKTTISKAIKDNISTFATVTVALIGAVGTILFEIGKYLKNLPVN